MEKIKVNYSSNKGFRLLLINEKLNKGEHLCKTELANELAVTPKTIQRDISDLRNYLAETHTYEHDVSIKYDKSENKYYLIRLEREWFTNEEVLAFCKILLESRAFNKTEMKRLIDKFLEQASHKDKQSIKKIINSENVNYIPLKHNKNLLNILWNISTCIENQKIICFTYKRQDGAISNKTVKPIGIKFSEFYFYLVAFMVDDAEQYPIIFRVDRMTDLKNTNTNFRISSKKRFNEAEFFKRVQFMYSGKLQSIEFEFSGASLEACLDKIPTAKVVKQVGTTYIIEAESYGKGLEMWLNSQGDKAKIIKIM